MPKGKNTDIHKVTLNLRQGDLVKMKALFPSKKPSVAVRELVSAFIDKHYDASPTAEVEVETDL